MSNSGHQETTDQAVVKTYVPSYQKASWKAQADDLGMSQAEFVRTMVQAGRKEFEIDSSPTDPERSSPPADPGGNDLERRVLDSLKSAGVLSWDGLVDSLSSNFEDRLEAALDSLQEDNRVRYSGRDGGYTVVDGVDE